MAHGIFIHIECMKEWIWFGVLQLNLITGDHGSKGGDVTVILFDIH